jgi:hypothetical protein
MPKLFATTLAEQIAEVKREIGFRERVYAHSVQNRRISQYEADRRIEIMKAVLDTLQSIKQEVA